MWWFQIWCMYRIQPTDRFLFLHKIIDSLLCAVKKKKTVSYLICGCMKSKFFKGQVQSLGWFLIWFPLKFAENNDVGELWSEGYKCTKTGIFCHTKSVAMTLKIMCTYAHYITLGSCCKMASSHRLGGKNPVWISKDEAPTPWLVVGPLFISSLLFHLSWALLGAWRFSLFHSV